MHVHKDISRQRIDSFIQIKYKKLRTTLGKYDARFVFYDALAFTNMMNYFFATLRADGLRIYIASYGPKDSDSVPPGYEDLLTLIFAPTTDSRNPRDIGNYYIIFPGMAYQQLDNELAIAWVRNYRSIKLPDLNETVESGQDTKSIYYDDESITDLVAEMACQEATGIKAYFCSMRDDDDYKQQLMLDFILTSKIGNDEVEFNVQDRDGWDDRPAGGDLDTGSPCPPDNCFEFPPP